MIKVLDSRCLIIIVGVAVALCGCASNQPDPKPSELGQCTIIRQEDAYGFEVSKHTLIGKTYAIYSKFNKDVKPRGPYILRDISILKSSPHGTWWSVRFNGQPIDLAEIFIETSPGTLENLIIVKRKELSGS